MLTEQQLDQAILKMEQLRDEHSKEYLKDILFNIEHKYESERLKELIDLANKLKCISGFIS